MIKKACTSLTFPPFPLDTQSILKAAVERLENVFKVALLCSPSLKIELLVFIETQAAGCC